MDKKLDEKQVAENKAEKRKALDAVFGAIEKQYGKGSIMKLGEAPHVDVDVIPTGSMTLDMPLAQLDTRSNSSLT